MSDLPRFVWVDTSGRWSAPHIGILLAWRKVSARGEERWMGWVIEAWMGGLPAHGGERPYVLQAWYDAAHIRPAEAVKPEPDLSGYHPPRGRQ